MSFIIILSFAFVSGLLGGMGMGGGTVLIPALTLFAGTEQHIAQAANLIAFLPMSLISLKIHSGNGLLRTRGTLPPCSCPFRARSPRRTCHRISWAGCSARF